MNFLKTEGIFDPTNSRRLGIKVLACTAAILISVIFVATCIHWPGSLYTYVLFTAAFNGLLFTAIKRQHATGYLFLTIVLWIGFWLKLSINLIFSTTWMEPVGNFDFSQNAFDHVAIVASVGALGVLISGIAYRLLSESPRPYVQTAPFKHNKYYWMAGLFTIAVLSIFNEKYQIIQAFRPPPVLDLPFRLQGLITWYFGGGWGILLMIPFYKSFCEGKDVRAVSLLVIAGAVISTTVFSRGVLVFQALIILLPLLVYRNLLPPTSIKKLSQYILIIFLGVCFSVLAAMERRTHFFVSINPDMATSSRSSTWFYIAKLPIDRWIGLEALMAVSAFEGKSYKFLIERGMEPRAPGKVDFYTHKIALNPTTDTKVVNYSTPPGFIAFSYFSGSKWFVGGFAFLLALILISSERLILKISRNPFLAASVGIGLTVQIIHMGTGGLSNPIKIFLTSIAVAIFLGWIQRKATGRPTAA